MGGLAAMTLEHYPGMTEGQIAKVEVEAARRWPLEASLVIHRFGRLEPGDPIVAVVTASAHRRGGIRELRVPDGLAEDQRTVWKHEEHADGERWVDAPRRTMLPPPVGLRSKEAVNPFGGQGMSF